ncbi:hypothetical protein PAMP_013816 [Pampus punctatissimus]
MARGSLTTHWWRFSGRRTAGKSTVTSNYNGFHINPQVTVLGTPAEEDGGGKIDLLKPLITWTLQICCLWLSKSSTDFDNVTFVVPGIHPYFYIGSKALNHTEEYTVASGDDRTQFYTLRTAKA